MSFRVFAAVALILFAACSPSPRVEPPPPIVAANVPDRADRGREIVAFLNGEPLTWGSVAEKMLELDLKTAVDQYVRWRLVEDRRKALKIDHTPEELRQRAEVYARQTRKEMGEEAFRSKLAREGATQEAWVAHLAGSRFLNDLLTMDKILRFDSLLVDTLEIDRMVFAEEADAKKFVESARAKGFDTAAGEVTGTGERRPTLGRIPREVFPRTSPPVSPVLDEWILEELLKLKPGQFTGVEHSRSNFHYVVLLRNLRKGRNVSYDDVKGEVVGSILNDPPATPDYLRWLDRQMAQCRIEYGARKPAPGK
jgi:hypothetical protein